MSGMARTVRGRRRAIWLAVAVLVLLVAAANGHLAYVATVSQPDCVAHVRPGEGQGAIGRFSAARSSCTPAASSAAANTGGSP